jgi:DNA-directed RNA polymerase specialized sigma24 family protein
MKEETNPVATQQEKYFLNTFPLINQIILKKLGFIPSRFVDDLIQQIKFKLWRWKQNHLPEKELSSVEWEKIANVAAHNEVKDYRRRKENKNVLFSELAEDEQGFPLYFDQHTSIEGETKYESMTLLILIWRKYQKLSLRQKYAFLFHKYEFVTFLLKFGCCTPAEIAETLTISENEFLILLEKIPLTDVEILHLWAEKSGEQITCEQVRTARSKAKIGLQKNLPG